MSAATLLEKLERREALVGVIGMGYVGLPLARAFAEAGFRVLGFDVNPDAVAKIQAGTSYIDAVPTEVLAELRRDDRLSATTDMKRVTEVDALAICVPTPLTLHHDPDTSFIERVATTIAPHLSADTLVVLESTTYPGTTAELLEPRLRAGSGRTTGEDLFVAYSPERENPGDAKWSTSRIPKVVGADDDASLRTAVALYTPTVSQVVPVSSTRAAEATKLLENIYRCVNIALVNELKLCFQRMGIDIYEVIDAARTKPFGFQAFWPGPGLGGHCLAGGEVAWVRDEDGLHVLSFEELFAREAARWGSTTRPDGVDVVEPRGLTALSLDPSGASSRYAPVTHLFRRAERSPLLRIRTHGNRSITVTGRHPMLVSDGGVPQVREAQDLSPDDGLVALTEWPEPPSWDDTLDLVDLVLEHAIPVRVLPRRGTWRSHEAVLRPAVLRRKGSPKDVFRHNTLPLQVFLDLEEQGTCPFTRDQVFLVTGKGRSWQRIPARIRIDAAFARLLGYYLAEGCLTEDSSLRVRWCFGGHERELVEDVQSILADLGIRSSTHDLKSCDTTHVKVSSRILGVLFRDVLGCGTRSEDACVPPRLLAAPAEVRDGLLAGLLRGDGDVDASSSPRTYRKGKRSYTHVLNTATVGYFTSSPRLLQQVFGLLQSKGLVPARHGNRPHVRVHGEQVEALEPLLIGAKARNITTCRERRRRSPAPRSYTTHGPFATVRVRSVTPAPPSQVYSMEVAGNHTFLTSYGLVVHNCIPIDPVYLSWKAKAYGVRTRFIDLASEVNTAMPDWVVERLMHALNEHGKPLKGSKVLVLGVAYKKNVDDVRESPALVLIEALRAKGAQVSYHDPHVEHVGRGRHYAIDLDSVPLDAETLAACDAALIVTDHDEVDYAQVVAHAPLVVDTRNATREVRGERPHVFLA